jgi:hypothetical protein
MMDSDGYRKQINSLGLGKLRDMTVSNQSDAKEVLMRVRDFQKRLRQIKREINLDMKMIRTEYREKSSTAGGGLSVAATLFGKKKLAGSIRASAKRGLAKERENVLAPYEKLKLDIDSLLTKLDSLKMQLESYIKREKTKERTAKGVPKSKETSEVFCPRCGSAISSNHEFCPKCGQKLHLT